MAEEVKEEKKTQMFLKGFLLGHNGWVTAIAMGSFEGKPMLISGSRDKSLIRWEITPDQINPDDTIGKPLRMYKGHSHFISDLALSQDSNYALTSSWDKTIRIWNLKDATTKQLFQGHTKDVLAVALSSDNKFILTGGRDQQLKLWTVNGENKHSIENAHEKWISCIKFATGKNKEIYTAGWDNVINVWDAQTLEKKATLAKHTNFITCLANAPSGTIVGSGSKDGQVILWNMDEKTPFKTLAVGKQVNCLTFSTTLAWVAVGTSNSVQIWNIKDTEMLIETILVPHKSDEKNKQEIQALCICFDQSSTQLHVGCSDSNIRIYSLMKDA